jgi:cell division inhibitor SepF
MSVFKKAMFYLGLGPDDAYDDEPLEPERPPVRAQRPPASSYPGPEESSGTVRAIPARPPAREPVPPRGMQPPPSEDPPAVTIRPRQGSSAVRTVAPSAQPKPHTVRPRRFDEAQEVADHFKEGQPVIVNLQDVDRDLLRRIVDFASGLCYGLGGTMEKVAVGVYLLTPANATVSAEDRQALAERGLLD